MKRITSMKTDFAAKIKSIIALDNPQDIIVARARFIRFERELYVFFHLRIAARINFFENTMYRL